jgi:hypothetical protein
MGSLLSFFVCIGTLEIPAHLQNQRSRAEDHAARKSQSSLWFNAALTYLAPWRPIGIGSLRQTQSSVSLQNITYEKNDSAQSQRFTAAAVSLGSVLKHILA